ncbi:hypothetical protein [Mesorhizobium sp. M8A.F.Ca.ET.021.01.1.1]|uniref:hypothetical protein n=1 Tax=Mesorhizobium sp. M8A.F.Ca.ET.021.01.1.1 TaxID=2496757 RepID=UPI000FCA3FBF|nr:hypothetical protein [Mesorhizobium sp. M8A.F.Ca.ET.021.01.1.1]
MDRYTRLEFYDPDLRVFMNELIDGCESAMPICKANRWLGYIQGVLIERGLLTVQEERDATRPYFRPLDFRCSTCSDTKRVDERLGGEPTSGVVECPDCQADPIKELRAFLSDIPMQHTEWQRVEYWLSALET